MLNRFVQVRFFAKGVTNAAKTTNEQNDVEAEHVPEIYREHRHRFSKKPEDIDAFKRQLLYRSKHLGTKELEIVIGDWFILN